MICCTVQQFRKLPDMRHPLGNNDRCSAAFNRRFYIICDQCISEFAFGNLFVYFRDCRFIVRNIRAKLCKTRYQNMRKTMLCRIILCISGIPDRAALHENDRLVPVGAFRRRGQPVNIFRVRCFQDTFKALSRYMMTFVHNKYSVVIDKRLDLMISNQ